MNDKPLLSFVVLSYNYEHYIDKTIQSILDQTVQDFEIVVLDDCSRDHSVEVLKSFHDPRIRLFLNEKNLGGTASYNLAISKARGEWLVNLDADDWIAPNKVERQLDMAKEDPSLDIIGSYVCAFDEHSLPHPDAEQIEASMNQPHDFRRIDTWLGANRLCRSSTIVRRAAQTRIGPMDTNMVRAPDYELWTRALREGCGIATLPEKLTFMRLHSAGITHGNPLGTIVEMSYAMLRNLFPLAEQRALHPSIARMIAWVTESDHLSQLTPSERYRLIGMLLQAQQVGDFASFEAILKDPASNPELEVVGRRTMALLDKGAPVYQDKSKLEKDVKLYLEARDYWMGQSNRWERAYQEATGTSGQ